MMKTTRYTSRLFRTKDRDNDVYGGNFMLHCGIAFAMLLFEMKCTRMIHASHRLMELTWLTFK